MYQQKNKEKHNKLTLKVKNTYFFLSFKQVVIRQELILNLLRTRYSCGLTHGGALVSHSLKV